MDKEKVEVKLGYVFDEKKHIHTLDGKPLNGVTTVLGVIAKPLTWWASGEALKALGWTNPKLIKREEGIKIAGKARANFFIKNEEYYDWLQECYRAHNTKKVEAGTKGTDIHALIEERIVEAIKGEGYINGHLVNEEPQVSLFVEWAMENKVKFLASERHLYSRKLWIGGIVDFIGEIAGKRIVGDIKTSSAVYPEHFLQTSAYDLMLQEMGEPKSDKHIIVNVKKDGGFEVKENYDYEGNSKAFLAALTLYRQLESLK